MIIILHGGPDNFAHVNTQRQKHSFHQLWNSSDSHDGMFETRRQGVFAVGDVRSGSVKRVASAVGEGAVAIRQVHEFLEAAGRR